MIEIIRKWCENILVSICISIIIEMLVPEGKNKKYIKVVIGIYIVFVTINPIFELLNYILNYELFQNINSAGTSEIQINSNENIKNAYINAIEENIKMDIKELGYEIESVKISLDRNYENIEKIELKVLGKNNNNNTSIEKIEPIIIGKDTKGNTEYNEIEDYLANNYSISKEKIIYK